MNEVYVVLQHFDYEGSELLDIFSTKEKAFSYTENYIGERISKYKGGELKKYQVDRDYTTIASWHRTGDEITIYKYLVK